MCPSLLLEILFERLLVLLVSTVRDISLLSLVEFVSYMTPAAWEPAAKQRRQRARRGDWQKGFPATFPFPFDRELSYTVYNMTNANFRRRDSGRFKRERWIQHI